MEDRVRMLCEAIHRYLGEHPDAADSVTGIRQWWLADIGFDAAEGEVKAALDRLVGEGAVQSRLLSGERVLYSRAGPRRG